MGEIKIFSLQLIKALFNAVYSTIEESAVLLWLAIFEQAGQQGS